MLKHLKESFPVSKDFFLDSLFVLIFSLVAITSLDAYFYEQDLTAKVYLIPYWSQPFAYASFLGSIFYLCWFFKLRSWKYALTIFLFYDTMFEAPGSIAAIFHNTWQSYQTGFIFSGVVISALLFRQLKVKYNRFFWFAVCWAICCQFFIVKIYDFVPVYTELPVLVPLGISLYLGINKPEKNILTQSQAVTNNLKQESMMK